MARSPDPAQFPGSQAAWSCDEIPLQIGLVAELQGAQSTALEAVAVELPVLMCGLFTLISTSLLYLSSSGLSSSHLNLGPYFSSLLNVPDPYY